MAHPKGILLERAAKLGLERPEFRTERTGPEHEPNFLTDVIVAGEVLGTGQGGSKRTAEKRAAEEALEELDARDADEPTAKADDRAVKGKAPARAKDLAPATGDEPEEEEEEEEEELEPSGFDGPWPMFDDLLAAVLKVAERRVYADLRGDEARAAIRDFSLTLYKELLSDLGDVVEEDEDDDDEDSEDDEG